MKRKRLILNFSIVFILMTVIGFILLTSSEADNQVSINGIPQEVEVVQGVTGTGDEPLVLLTTNNELQKLYDSIDSTGEYTYSIPKYVISSETNELTEPRTVYITAMIDELRQWKLSFDYIIEDGRRQLLKGVMFMMRRIFLEVMSM
jgi:hypothetical protein